MKTMIIISRSSQCRCQSQSSQSDSICRATKYKKSIIICLYYS